MNGPVALGNASFAFTLSGASGPPARFILGIAQLNLPCGPCPLVPALHFVVPAPAPLPLPIPWDAFLYGGSLYAQWIVSTPGPCPLLSVVSFSSAIRVTIGA